MWRERERERQSHLEAMAERERALYHIDAALADVNPSNGTDTAAHLHACRTILQTAGSDLGNGEHPPKPQPQHPPPNQQPPNAQQSREPSSQNKGGDAGGQHRGALELDEAARQAQHLLEQEPGVPTKHTAQHLATIQELIMRGVQKMEAVQKVSDWQVWGGGEIAGQVSLELTQQLLHELNTACDAGGQDADRQQQHHLQASMREILTHIHQAIAAHEVVVAAQWMEPTSSEPAQPPIQHAKVEGTTDTHPVDVIGLAKGGTESHSNRPKSDHRPNNTVGRYSQGAPSQADAVQEEATMAAQAISALDDWQNTQWGEPIVLLESQLEGGGPGAFTDPNPTQGGGGAEGGTQDTTSRPGGCTHVPPQHAPEPPPTGGRNSAMAAATVAAATAEASTEQTRGGGGGGGSTQETIPWEPPPPTAQAQPADNQLQSNALDEAHVDTLHLHPLHTHSPLPPQPHTHTHSREPTEEFTSSQSEEEDWGEEKRPKGWGLHRQRRRLQERDNVDSRRRRTHEGASSD